MNPANESNSSKYSKQTGYVLSALQLGLGALVAWKTPYRAAGTILIGSASRSVFYTFKEKGTTIDATSYLRHSASGAVGGLFSSFSFFPQAGGLISKAGEVFFGILGGVAAKTIEEGKLPDRSQLVKQALNGTVGPLTGALAGPLSGKILEQLNLGANLKDALRIVAEAGASTGASKISDNYLSGNEWDQDVLASMALCGLICGSLRSLRNLQIPKVQNLIDSFGSTFEDLKQKQDWLEKNVGHGPKKWALSLLDQDSTVGKDIKKFLIGEGLTSDDAEKAVQYWLDLSDGLKLLERICSQIHFNYGIFNSLDFTPKLTKYLRKPNLDLLSKVDPNSPAPINVLSIDALSRIIRLLTPNDIRNCARVSKAWNRLLNNERFRDLCGISESYHSLSAAQRLLEDIPLYRRFKRVYHINLASNVIWGLVVENRFSVAFLVANVFFTRWNHHSTIRNIQRLEHFPPQKKKTLMEDYNASPVLIRVSQDEWEERERREDEKFTDIDKFIDFRKGQERFEEVFLFLLSNIPAALMLRHIFSEIPQQAQNVRQFLSQRIVGRLQMPATLSQDPLLQNYVDPITGRVMALPVETNRREVFDFLTLFDPITETLRHPVTGQLMEWEDLRFREDLFNHIHSYLTTLRQLPGHNAPYYHTQPITRENRLMGSSLDPLYHEVIKWNINLETTKKILGFLKKMDRANPATQYMVELFESKVNDFINTLTTENKPVFLSLIPDMRQAGISCLHLPFIVTSEDLEAIREMPLRVLSIGNQLNDQTLSSNQIFGQFTSHGLSFLEGMPLETLILKSCPWITHLRSIRQIETLRKLDLSFCNELKANIGILAGLRLEELDLTGTNVDDSIIPLLADMPLRKLSIKRTNFTQDGVNRLRKEGLHITSDF